MITFTPNAGEREKGTPGKAPSFELARIQDVLNGCVMRLQGLSSLLASDNPDIPSDVSTLVVDLLMCTSMEIERVRDTVQRYLIRAREQERTAGHE